MSSFFVQAKRACMRTAETCFHAVVKSCSLCLHGKTAHHTSRTMRGFISYTLSGLIPNNSCILINGTIVYIGNLNTVICMDNLAVTDINRYMVYHTGL